MNNPFDFFDCIFCVNLDKRVDRWEESKLEFSKIGILDRIERISGIITNRFDDQKRNASYGNHLSHAECLRRAKERDLSNCLIFEDDVKFINKPLEILEEAVKELPKDYDIFYLGANTEKTLYRVSAHLARLTFAYSTHAYCINKHLFERLYLMNLDPDVIHNDVEYNHFIVRNNKCYSPIPLIAVQRKSYSDIEDREMNYDWMEKRFNENLINVDNQT